MGQLRRRQVLIAAGAILAAPYTGMAQQQGKVWRIGFLSGGARPANGVPLALRESLAKLGYVEGNNVVYEGRWADAKFDRLPALASELVERRVDAIVVLGWIACQEIKRATSTIPIVTAAVGDAIESGLAASMARPGANLTGMSDPEAELSAKRLQLLKDVVPKAKRIAVLWNQDDLAMTLRYRQIEMAARGLRVIVQRLGVREPDDFGTAFATMTRERPDALIMITDALTALNRNRVIEYAALNRIPAIYERSFLVQDGGLMSYGSNTDETYHRDAYFVDRILKGTKPADLPMEQPTHFYLFINLKTAKTLGIKFPNSILMQATNVIE